MDQPALNNPPARAAARLGEELPVFCEKCGYSLHGLPQSVCDHCTIRQFHCPECGHHQPINTLRPAFQQMLGRCRAGWLAGLVVFKLAFFAVTLLLWVVMGSEWTYTYRFTNTATVQPGVVSQPTYEFALRSLDWESMFAFGLYALFFTIFGRMLLLRWRRGWVVGLVLAALVVSAIAGGAEIASRERWRTADLPSPFGPGLWAILCYTGILIWTIASVTWGIWVMLVRAFLPPRIGGLLLDWQRSQSMQVSALSRQDNR